MEELLNFFAALASKNGRRYDFLYLTGLVLTKDSWEQGQVRKDAAPRANVTAPMPTIVEEIGEFASSIKTGQKLEIGGDVALQNLAVVLAAVESAKSGDSVEV